MAEGSIPISGGSGYNVDTFDSGGSGARRQVIVIGDPTTTGNVAGVSSAGYLLAQIRGDQPAATTGSWTSATGSNTAVTATVSDYNTVTVSVRATSTITGGVITFEASDDGTNWFPISVCRIDSFTVENTYTLVASTNRMWSTSVDGMNSFRVRLSTVITGTATVSVSITPQAFAIEPISVVGQSVAANLQATVTQASGNWADNLVQLNGTTVDTNSGNKSAGTQRIVIATDQPNLTTPLNVNTVPATSGGFTTYHLVSAATTNATNIKASAGQVFGWYIYNSNAAARKVAFHNASGTPTAGASIFFTIIIPPTSAANVFTESGIAFSTGIAISTVTGLADSDATAVALNDLNINIFYK